MHLSHCFTYRKYRGYRYSSVSGRAAPPKAKGPSVCGRHFEESELPLCEKAGIAHNSKTASVAFIRQMIWIDLCFGNHVIVGRNSAPGKALDFSGCNSRPGTGSLHPVEAIEAAAWHGFTRTRDIKM